MALAAPDLCGCFAPGRLLFASLGRGYRLFFRASRFEITAAGFRYPLSILLDPMAAACLRSDILRSVPFVVGTPLAHEQKIPPSFRSRLGNSIRLLLEDGRCCSAVHGNELRFEGG